MKEKHVHSITKEGKHLHQHFLNEDTIANYEYNLYQEEGSILEYNGDYIFSSLSTAELRLLDLFYNPNGIRNGDYVNPMNIPYYEMRESINEELGCRDLPAAHQLGYHVNEFFIKTFNLEITRDAVDQVINKYKNKYKLTHRFNPKDKLPGLNHGRVYKSKFIIVHYENLNDKIEVEHSWDFIRNKECPDSIWGRATNKELRIIELYLMYGKGISEHSDGSHERKWVSEELNLRNIPLASELSFGTLDKICKAINIESPVDWYHAYWAHRRFSKEPGEQVPDSRHFPKPEWEIMNDDFFDGMSQDELDAWRDNTE